MDLHIPDLSEYQTTVDFSKLGPAVILRAHNGRRVDRTFAARLPQARAHQQVRLFYGYMVADRDAATQGRELAKAVGTLQPGEAFVCDAEAGSGNQAGRVKAYLDQLAGRDIEYSGEAFYHAHLNNSDGKGLLLWVAAYRSAEPTTRHFLWQHTDHQSFPGVSSACDCSIFHGTVQDLKRLVSPPPPAKPAAKPSSKPASKPPAKPARYKIRNGDTLAGIARAHHTTAQALYSKNAKVLDDAARKHGRPNSAHGSWIYPGTVISL